jgi:hypothetical protein
MKDPGRVLALALGVVWAVLFFGIVDLVTVLGTNPYFVDTIPLEASWGAYFTFMVALPACWMAVGRHTAGAIPAFFLLCLSALALIVGCAATFDPWPLLVAAGITLTAACYFLSPDRTIRLPKMEPSWLLLVLAVVGAPGWLLYALLSTDNDMAGRDVTLGLDHAPVQVALGLALAVAPAMLALWPASRRLLRISISASSVAVGVASLGFPDAVGAIGSYQASLGAVVWGLAIALASTPKPRGAQESRQEAGRSAAGRRYKER